MISKKEKLLQKAYDAYIDLMLRDFPLDRIEELVVSDVTGFGTTLDEKILDLNRLKKVVTDQREQGTGMDIRFVTSPLHRRIDPEENFAIYVDEIEISMIIDGDKNIIPLRLSSVFEFINNSWKLVHLHGSKAVESEGDTWHKEEWKKQNEKLQKQVEKKTADLAKKNWELEIETSLQRVRTVAMGMRKPEDLAEMSAIIFEELKALGLKNLRNSEIIINKDDQDSILSYYYSDYGITGKIELEYKSNPIIQKWANDLKKAGDAFAKVEISPKEIDDWRKYRESIGYLPDPKLDKAKSVYYYSYSTGLGALSISSFKVISKEAVKLLERFRNVFALAYRRYADVAKAEKQAREAQIELALERVRASTMAMQKSEELGDVAILLFKELNQLVDNLWTCGFVLCEKDRDEDEWWLSTEDGFIPAFYLPNVGDKTHENIYNAWKRGETYHTEQVEGDDLTEHYEWLMNNPVSRKIFEDLEAAGMERPDWQKLHCAFFSSGYLVMITRVPCPEEAIFKRFAQVFNQTYTRFLDLQKAEEQAREAQIEAALERVRSQAMAIRKSDELIEVIQIIFQEMEKLGFDIMECSIVIYDINPKDFIYWTSSSGDSALPSSYKLQYINHPVMSDLIKDLESGVQYRSGKFSGEILKTWWDRVFTESDFKNSPIEYIESWKKVKQLFYSQAAMSHGFLEFLGSTPLPEDKVEVLKRFTKVVDLAYTRHDDVVKAEAQAREAQIEAALEKVRSRSLAMHTTNELGEVVVTLVEKLKDLDVVLDANGVVLCTYFQDSKDVMHWIASPDFSFAGSYLLPYFDHPIFNDAWQSKESGTEYFSKAYSVDEKNSFFEYAFEHSDYKHFPDDFKQWVFQNDQHILSFAWQKNSAILIPSHTGVLPSEEDVEILKRFAKVFEQSYVRFLDLKKAEAQAREAQIEFSLERIRAQVTSMQKSSDLLDIVVTMRTEFVSLGHEAHYFWYMRYHPETYEKAMTSGDGTRIGMVMSLASPYSRRY